MRSLLIIACFFVQQPDIPELNKKIIDFVNQSMGKTVGAGECWDLAALSLEYAGAFHDRSSEKTIYVFGKVIDPEKKKIYPGDIIQMKNVKLQYKKDNGIYTENMAHHTAIVYQVNGKGDFEIAHQNTSFSGRKVGKSSIRLDDVKSGKLTFYRPISK